MTMEGEIVGLLREIRDNLREESNWRRKVIDEIRTTTTTGSALAKDGPRGRGSGNPGWCSFRLFLLHGIIREITKPSVGPSLFRR